MKYGYCKNVAVLVLCSLSIRSSATPNNSEVLLPAGTILQCSLSEPTFSSVTAQVGDPVLCHLREVTEFGQLAFPRGSCLIGHLDSVKDPGHFFGKGSLTITFDRIGLPSGDLPLVAKIIAVRGYRVEKEGKIDGKGHARRDAVEWLLPPLWPLKVITLPARGPRPKLKPETTLSLRLMDDVQIPRAVSSNRSEWRFFGKAQNESFRNSAYYQHESGISHMPPRESTMTTLRNPIPMNIVTPADRPETLIVLKDGTIYIAREYWVDGWRMHFIGEDGEERLVALARIDLNQTVRLNHSRDVEFILQSKNRAGEP